MEEVVVEGPILRVGGVDGFEMDLLRDVFETQVTQSDCRNEGGPAGIGLDGVLQLVDLHIHHVGQDLAPDIGLGPTADKVQVFKFAAHELFGRFDQPAGVEGHAFQESPDNVLAGGLERHVKEGSPHIPVVHGGTLAEDPGHIHQPMAARGSSWRRCDQR